MMIVINSLNTFFLNSIVWFIDMKRSYHCICYYLVFGYLLKLWDENSHAVGCDLVSVLR